MIPDDCVWVFHGDGGRFAGGVFRTLDRAERWILDNRLSGLLTAYPLDECCFDWAVRLDLVSGSVKARRTDPAFLGSFTSANQHHLHFLDGVKTS